jgi:hypothetical protein
LKDDNIHIQIASPENIGDMVRASSAFRSELAEFQPQMWRKASDADERQREFFAFAISREQNISLIAADETGFLGFLIASLIPAPPVYEPGGLTCLVDDFAVASPSDWPRVGRALISQLNATARDKGAVQTVVICPHLSAGKRELLERSGYSLASEWWVGRLD